MVWGMPEPKGFGEFWPDGTFEAWFDDLRDYYSNRMSDEDKTAMGMEEFFDLTAITNKFKEDLGPVKPPECPKEFTVHFKKNTGDYGSLITLSCQVLAVDDALKTIIEALEPEVHQFWPIRLVTLKTRKVYPQSFFGIRIGQYLDSFSPEQSTEGSWRVNEKIGRYRAYFSQKKYYEGLALSQEAIGQMHLWSEKRLRHPRLFLSDTLMSKIKEAGLRVPKHYKMKSV